MADDDMSDGGDSGELPGSNAADYTGLKDAPPDNSVPFGPPNPFEASPDEPGSYGPPKSVLSETAHVDDVKGSGPTAGAVDYSSMFATAVKTAGAVAAATAGSGLPAPVAVSAAAAAAARQQVVNQQAASSAVQTAQSSAPKPAAKSASTISTGAAIGLGLGALTVVGLVALTATRKARR